MIIRMFEVCTVQVGVDDFYTIAMSVICHPHALSAGVQYGVHTTPLELQCTLLHPETYEWMDTNCAILTLANHEM